MAPPSAESMAHPAGGTNRWGERLRANQAALRLVSASALALPAGAAFFLGHPLLGAFVGLIAVIMGWEWMRICGNRFGLAGFALVLGLAVAVSFAALDLYGWCLAAILAAAPAITLVAMTDRQRHSLWIGAGALYIGLPVLSILWLYHRADFGKPLVIWLIVTVIATDVGAYIFGRAIGGPRLAPRISPAKTWSGLVGGMICALGLGAAGAAMLGLGASIVWPAAAAILALVAQGGDLLESGIKRRFGVKDASRLMPGHGGIMDRVDGLVAAAVVLALVVWLAGGDPRSWL